MKFGGVNKMPAYMRKIKGINKYKVLDKDGRVFAESTTRIKAEGQVRILNGR
jgi:hypothetical protein